MLYIQSKKGCFKKEYMRKIGAGRGKKKGLIYSQKTHFANS